MRKTVSFQIVLVLILAGLGWLYGGMPVAQAAVFGGLIAMTNTLLLTWRMLRGQRHPHADVQRHLRSFYASAIERFVLVAVMFGIGIAVLNLVPAAVLTGFIVGMLGFYISGLTGGIG